MLLRAAVSAAVLLTLCACAPPTEDVPDDAADAAPSSTATDLDARAALIADCLNQQGFPAEAVGSEVVAGAIPPEQGPAQAAAFADCEARYPLPAEAMQPLNENQLRFFYAYFVEELAPCLAELGFVVEAAPPIDVWLEQPEPTVFWNPWLLADEQYFGAGQLSVDEVREVRLQCPHEPPLAEILAAR